MMASTTWKANCSILYATTVHFHIFRKCCASCSELILRLLWSDVIMLEFDSRKTLHAQKIWHCYFSRFLSERNPAMVRISSIFVSRETNFHCTFDQLHRPSCTASPAQLQFLVLKLSCVEWDKKCKVLGRPSVLA